MKPTIRSVAACGIMNVRQTATQSVSATIPHTPLLRPFSKRCPFTMRKDTFYRAKAYLSEGKRMPFATY